MHVVTGATGHVGNVIVRELLARGKTVKALIRKTSNKAVLEGLKVEKALGNILDLDSLLKAFRHAEVVFHSAAEISILSGRNKLIYETNVEGTRNVIKACIMCGVKRLIYISSIHAIKEPPCGVIIDESLPFGIDNAIGEYARSKAKASLDVFKSTSNGLDAVIVCPTGVIGPYDYKISSLSKTFIDFVNRKLMFSMEGAYDFVDVRDVAAGCILACDKGKMGESYILSGERITIDELMSILEDITGIKKPRFKIPVMLAKTAATFSPIYYKLARTQPLFTRYSIYTLLSNSSISHKKASNDLGYFPRVIKKAVEDNIKWLKEYGAL
ncbi:MAG: SDR family oxidoreductase [Actinobacteria bacterium]|nr:SDR family oxidoreductase [Actinomycetota bacterium]